MIGRNNQHYRIKDGKIERFSEGTQRYDVDWGNYREGRGWWPVADDTPEMRKYYGIS